MKKRALTKKPRYHASILILDFPTSRTLHSAQFSSVAQSCLTLCDPMECSTPGLPVHHQLPEFTQTHVHWVGDAIQPPHPLSSPSPPTSIFPSIRVFSNESVFSIRWPKYWSFSFNISPSNEYPGLISFRIDWLDLLAVQRTVKSLLKHHSSKALILQHSAFFIVQFSHPYMTTGKTMALTRQTFVGKVMSLLFNMLSRLVIPFLPRNKHLNFMAAVTICSDFGDKKKKKSATVSTVSPAICHEVMGHYIITKKKKKDLYCLSHIIHGILLKQPQLRSQQLFSLFLQNTCTVSQHVFLPINPAIELLPGNSGLLQNKVRTI